MARRYYQEDCTVFSFNADTGLKAFIASGSINRTKTEAENAALMDEYENGKTTRKKVEVSFKVAVDSELGSDFVAAWENDTQLPLIITYTDGNEVNATFEVTSLTTNIEDAQTYDVTCTQRGDPN